MSLETKREFEDVLQNLIAISNDFEIDTKKNKALLDAVENMPLLVPVVGEFSAGKSTLLNNCIGKSSVFLPVNMTAETARPAELYFSETEYSESINENGVATKITDLKNLPGDCVYVKHYINSDFIKKLEPIVLVDMPGFDSPVGDHNKAIFSYLDKGSHYAVLVPVDAGTVSKSMTTQIHNIVSFGMECSFFLSKTDLRSEEEIEQVNQELKTSLSSIVGNQVNVYSLSQDNVSMFNSFANSLNPEKLFKDQFNERIIDACYDLKGSLNTKLAAIKSDKEKNKKAVEEIKISIKKIEETKEKLIEAGKNKTYSSEAEQVANAVGKALNSNLDTLASMAISSGKTAVEEEINSIVQRAAVSEIQTTLTNVSASISGEFTKEMKTLSTTLEEYGTPGMLDKIHNSAKDMFETGKTNVDLYIEERKEKKDTSVAYKAITGILAAATNIISPIIEVIIIMLPEIINLIFGNLKKQNQKEEAKQAIAGQIPGIKRNVRETAMKTLQENGTQMIAAISEKYDSELAQKKAEIESAKKEDVKQKEIDELIPKYEDAIKQTETLLKTLI